MTTDPLTSVGRTIDAIIDGTIQLPLRSPEAPAAPAPRAVLPFDLGTMRGMNLILQAARVASWAHRDQKRKFTGRPYVEHCGRVAARISRHPAGDEYMVAAAWLHDVLEDTPMTAVELSHFMPGLALSYVQQLTNPSKAKPHLSRAERKALDREHLRTCGGDVRRIKMADRVDNLLDLMHLEAVATPDKRQFVELYLTESEALLQSVFVPVDELTTEFRDTIATVKTWLAEWQ